MIVNPETKSYKEVGGFITIGSIFPETWNWQSFWSLTAFISIALAIMNLLPIPGLDGGHALFTLWEIITRRKPSDKFLEIMQYIGLGLLLLLLIYANGNDIIKLFTK
jgi:regulator of sigma E protease